ncbi:hypothetical protein ACXET9_15340 [Brachybacterium sp. DNPG3]
MIVIEMESRRILLAGAWVSVMLIYLLGDVIRIFAGHAGPGTIDGQEVASWVWTLASAIMLLPIAMILISLMVPATPLRWIEIIVSIALVIFNLAGFSSYAGFYDKMLLVISFAVNGLIVWLAWTWQPASA